MVARKVSAVTGPIPGIPPLAGKSTLNRLEHAPVGASRYHKIGHHPAAIENLFIALFLRAHKTPPRRIILDLDATDNPLHGHQEGRFFHGFCGRHLLAAKLRRSNIDACAGAVAEIERIVGQIRARWPRVRILLRADSGFAREQLMAWCEAKGVDYLFGLARNERLIGAIADELTAAEADSLAKGGAARRFADFVWRTLDSWGRSRRVVAKAEHLPKGPNPRFVVTSLRAAEINARSLYEDIYCARGEVENRIKACLAPRGDLGGRPGAASSSTCSPIARPRRPCAPISSDCGLPRWPMSCSRGCAGLPSGARSSATRWWPPRLQLGEPRQKARNVPATHLVLGHLLPAAG